jgi:chromosome segregation ATPase
LFVCLIFFWVHVGEGRFFFCSSKVFLMKKKCAMSRISHVFHLKKKKITLVEDRIARLTNTQLEHQEALADAHDAVARETREARDAHREVAALRGTVEDSEMALKRSERRRAAAEERATAAEAAVESAGARAGELESAMSAANAEVSHNPPKKKLCCHKMLGLT